MQRGVSLFFCRAFRACEGAQAIIAARDTTDRAVPWAASRHRIPPYESNCRLTAADNNDALFATGIFTTSTNGLDAALMHPICFASVLNF